MLRIREQLNVPFSSTIPVGVREFYVLATSRIIIGVVLICDNVQSWRLSSIAPLGNQAAGTMTQYPTQSHYPNTELPSPCLILLMPSTRLGSDK